MPYHAKGAIPERYMNWTAAETPKNFCSFRLAARGRMTAEPNWPPEPKGPRWVCNRRERYDLGSDPSHSSDNWDAFRCWTMSITAVQIIVISPLKFTLWYKKQQGMKLIEVQLQSPIKGPLIVQLSYHSSTTHEMSNPFIEMRIIKDDLLCSMIPNIWSILKY